MKNYLTFLFIIFSSFLFVQTTWAQIQFSVGIDVGSMTDTESTAKKTVKDIEYEYYSFDSTLTTYEATRNIDFTTKYAQRGSTVRLYGLAHIPITKRLNLVTGMGLDLSAFYVNTINAKVDKTKTAIKTEKVAPQSMSYYYNLNPDYPLNKPWALDNEVEVASLYIPIRFEFELIDNFRIGLGGKVNIPSYARYSSYSSSSLIDDKSKEAVSPISFEGSGSIKYRFLGKYELSFAASKYFSSITRTPKNNEQKGINQRVEFLKYKPFNYSAGFNYFF